MSGVQWIVAFLGRACLSFIFIAAGLEKIFDWQGSEQYFTDVLMRNMAYASTPLFLKDWMEMAVNSPTLWLAMAATCEIVGGLLIFLGMWVRFGALILVLFLIPTTFLFHDFWQLQGPDRALEMTMFLKNLSIIGGLLILLAYGKGCGTGKGCESASLEK